MAGRADAGRPFDTGPGAVADEIDKGAAILVTSVLAYAEVLGAHNTPDQLAKFKSFPNRTNAQVVDVYRAVADKGEQIRTRGCEAKPEVKFDVPGATFAAAAILFNADGLPTTDDKLLKASKTPLIDLLETGPPLPLSKRRAFC